MPSGRVSAGRAHCPAPRPRRPCRSGLKAWWRRTRSPKTERIRRRATPRVVRAFSVVSSVAAAALGRREGEAHPADDAHCTCTCKAGTRTITWKEGNGESVSCRRFSHLVCRRLAKRSRDRTGRARAVLRQLGAWRSPATVQQVGTALWRLANSLLPLGGQPELSCLCPGCRRPALSEGEWHPPPRLRPGRLTSTTSSPSSWRSVGAVRASRST